MVFFSSIGYDMEETEVCTLKKLIRNFERFCLQHRNKGIPNLMMYIALCSAVVYVMSLMDPAATVYNLLRFDRALILRGQVWRLLTFLIAPSPGRGLWNGIVVFLMLFFYYRIGLMLEQRMGTLKFNLFYFTGVLLVALAGLLFGWYVTSDSLHMSLILSFATLYSEARVLLFYFIPVKVKYLAWVYIIVTVVECVMWRTLLPILPLLNFLLFFWEELPNLLPNNWQIRRHKVQRQAPKQKPNPNWASSYVQKTPEKPYLHKCTVCGRTDADYPDLEFRYCSRCNGYYCYCMDHINNHTHIQ